jgi:hypothetical protein
MSIFIKVFSNLPCHNLRVFTFQLMRTKIRMWSPEVCYKLVVRTTYKSTYMACSN